MNPEEQARLEAEAEAEAEFQFQQQQLQQQSQNPQPVAAPEEDQNSGLYPYFVGAMKGVAKGIPSVVTAPADLITRGAVAGIESLTGTEYANPEEFYPSNVWSNVIDSATQGAPSNATAEVVGNAAGTIGGAVGAAPSALAKTASLTKKLGIVPRVLSVGSVGAGEGALANAALAAKDPNADLAREAKIGGTLGFLGATAPAVVGEVASDLAPKFSSAAQNMNERSIGAGVKDFIASEAKSGMTADASGRLQTKLSDAVESVRKEGVLPTFRNPASTSTIISNTKEEIGQQIGALVSEIDNAGIRPQLNFNNVDDLINNSPFTLKEDLLAQKEAFLETLKGWNGTASELHKAKSSIGNMAYSSKATGNSAKAFDKKLQRAIEKDLRFSIQNAMEEGVTSGAIPKESSQLFAEANKRFSNYATVETVVDDAALRAQHAPIGSLLRNAATSTGGFGVPAAMAYSQFGAPGALATVGIGALARTRAGQAAGAAMFRGGATAMDLLTTIGQNPYMTQVGSLAALPRTWQEVKEDDSAKEFLAARIGLDPVDFNSLPEPTQIELHKQAILQDPTIAEPTPGNLALYNGEYLNPMERDSIISQKLDASPEERAKWIGSSFVNKYPESLEPKKTVLPRQQAVPSIESLNSLLPSATPSIAPQISDAENNIRRLEEMTAIHARDVQ